MVAATDKVTDSASDKAVASAWRLVADVGGTNARFAVASDEGSISLATRYSVDQYPSIEQALSAFLDEVLAHGYGDTPDAACFALAGPIEGDEVRFTNSTWVASRSRLSRALGGSAVVFLNDFAAIGHAIPHLESTDWVQMGGGASRVDYPIVVLGPGTGLGVCTLVGTKHGVTVIEGEGGHADFAPTNKEEALVLDVLSARFGRVSIERLLSGDGLLNIYGALMELERLSSGQSGGSVVADPSDVSALALAGSDPVAVRALTMFCNILGSVAGNLALTLGAKAGVYIAGGIPGRILSFLETSDIRARFEAKGRFQSYLQNIPLRVVIKEDLGLLGAAHVLSNRRS